MVSAGSRRLGLVQGAIAGLMYEVIDTGDWADSLAEVVGSPNATMHPVVAFRTTDVWM